MESPSPPPIVSAEETAVRVEEEKLGALSIVVKAHEDELHNLPGVVGLGEGYPVSGESDAELGVVVLLDSDENAGDGVPTELDGFPVHRRMLHTPETPETPDAPPRSSIQTLIDAWGLCLRCCGGSPVAFFRK